MSDIDPDTLLEWLQTGHCDVTLLALEQLCTILLLSDNIDRCFERYINKIIFLFYFFNIVFNYLVIHHDHFCQLYVKYF